MPHARSTLAIELAVLLTAGCTTLLGGDPYYVLEDGGTDSGIDSGSAPLSCAPGGQGMTDCGAASESCCTSPLVSGGMFFRTYTNSGNGPMGEADPATVSSFRLDKYLVTVGRFRQFVAAWNKGYEPASGSGKHTHLNGGQGLAVGPNVNAGQTYESGWDPADDSNISPTDSNLGGDCGSAWTSTPGSQENLPISCTNWYESYAFCIWDGGFLPSDAELEYAAAAGSQQREYAWGTTNPGTNNEYAIYGCYYPGCGTPMISVAPVGTATLGAGEWGQLNLAGELFAYDLDAQNGFTNPCTDCYDPPSGSAPQDVRSMAYDSNIAGTTVLNAWASHSLGATSRQSYLGFRCARSP